MATYRLIVIKRDVKSDHTWNVKVRVTHKRKMGYIGTDKYVSENSFDKTFNITNEDVYKALRPVLDKYRELELGLGETINNYSVKQLTDYLRRDRDAEIDFLAFMNTVTKKIQNQGRHKTADGYVSAKNNLMAYTGLKALSVTMITSNFLKGFEEWLRRHKGKDKTGKKDIIKTMGSAGVNKNMSCIRHAFKEALDHYNDEDFGDVQIKHNPFRKYKIPVVAKVKNRNLEIDVVRKIRDGKYSLIRDVLAQDVFMISFYLMGMNCIDIYNCSMPKNGRIVYNRIKTKDRTEDNSEMSVKIEPELQPYLDKYKDKKYAFNFHRSYSDSDGFAKAVNKGLKRIGIDLKLELPTNLTSYYARHSWATIAANDCRVPIYVVNKSLAHVDPDMKMAEKYVKKSWEAIDEANRAVLDLLSVEKKPDASSSSTT